MGFKINQSIHVMMPSVLRHDQHLLSRRVDMFMHAPAGGLWAHSNRVVEAAVLFMLSGDHAVAKGR